MTKIRPAALFAALLLAIAALVVAGCGGGSSSSSSSSTSEESSEGSGGGAEEAEGGGETLTVGSDVPYPPFEEFGNSKSEFKGFDIELMEAIAKQMGRTVEFQDTSFETIFRDLAQGKFEAVISAATITEEREKTVDFSNPYYLSEQAVLVKEGSPIASFTDLKGETVGVQQGTTGQELAEKKAEAGEVRPFPEGPDAVNALKSGVVEAVVIDAPVAQDAVEKTAGIEIAEKVPTEEEYGIAVGQGESELLDEINEGLQEVENNGEYQKIYENWFKVNPPASVFTAKHQAE